MHFRYSLSRFFALNQIGTSDQCFVDSGFVSTGLTKMQSEMSREVYCGTTPPPLNYGKISTLFITLEGDKLAAESGFTLGYKSGLHFYDYFPKLSVKYPSEYLVLTFRS